MASASTTLGSVVGPGGCARPSIRPTPPRGASQAINRRQPTGPRPATIARRRELFNEAVTIIALEFSDPLSLQDLARRLATSPRQLQRAFAEAGQPGPRAYLRRVRMQRAAELLNDGASVGQVAWLVGYSQPAQFAKAFRREHGRLPGEVMRSSYGRLHTALPKAAT